MACVNRVTLIGYLGRDPEFNITNSDVAIVKLNLATTESFKRKDGVKEDRTEWHRVTFFGRTAEICNEYLSKGSQVYVEGRIETREWTDDDGNNRKSKGIVGTQMKMLGSSNKSKSDGSAPDKGKSKYEKDDDRFNPETEDDIPY